MLLFQTALRSLRRFLGRNHCFCHAHIVVTVVCADGDQVFNLRSIGRSRNENVIVLPLRVRESADRLDVLPRACIERIFGMSDGREAILGVKGQMELLRAWLLLANDIFERSLERGDDGRCGVHFEALADLFAGERFSGSVRGRIGGDDLDLVAAVGNQRGIKTVRLVGHLFFEQPPDALAVSAQEERVGEVIAVVVVRRPADCDGGAIFDSLQGR